MSVQGPDTVILLLNSDYHITYLPHFEFLSFREKTGYWDAAFITRVACIHKHQQLCYQPTLNFLPSSCVFLSQSTLLSLAFLFHPINSLLPFLPGGILAPVLNHHIELGLTHVWLNCIPFTIILRSIHISDWNWNVVNSEMNLAGLRWTMLCDMAMSIFRCLKKIAFSAVPKLTNLNWNSLVGKRKFVKAISLTLFATCWNHTRHQQMSIVIYHVRALYYV